MHYSAVPEGIPDYRRRGLSVCSSSSFQTHSVPLLHLLGGEPDIHVHLAGPRFLRAETYLFRDQFKSAIGLRVFTLRPQVSRLYQRCTNGRFLFASDLHRCCDLAKVQSLAIARSGYEFWISGIREAQTAPRQAMRVEQQTPAGVLRVDPLLDWTDEDICVYAWRHGLPEHPLNGTGDASIGCEPCTRRRTAGERRAGRWFGLQERECAVRTALIQAADPRPTTLSRFPRATDTGLK
jgi:phosphoadenosine phosphosulfate reductase